MDAVRLVHKGRSIREVARYTGYHPSTISRWVMRCPAHARKSIPTRSSRPQHHPHALAPELVRTILQYRHQHHRCAEVLHHLLLRDGHMVSLSSVKRVLKRNGISRYSPWKKWHISTPRPAPETPGKLVEIDTIHDRAPHERLYIYTMIDVCSRWAFAWPVVRIGGGPSARFLTRARIHVPFHIQTIQSDHGPEFARYFTKYCGAHGLVHRHIHVRSPNENGHLERFNRTIQEECLARSARSLKSWQRAIPEYLHFYNTERPHMGIGMRTPQEVLRSY